MVKEHPSVQNVTLDEFLRSLICSTRHAESHVDVFVIALFLPVRAQPFVLNDRTVIGPVSPHVGFDAFLLAGKPGANVERFNVYETRPKEGGELIRYGAPHSREFLDL